MIDAAVVDLRTLTGPDAIQAGIYLQNLVAYRIDLGELALAESNAAEALKIVSAQVEPESMTFAGTLAAHALAQLARRDAGAALEEFNRVIPIFERVLGAEREPTLLARTGKALAFAYLGRMEDAHREITAVSKLVAPKDALEPLGARVSQVRGTIARMRGDLPAALQAQSPLAALKDVGPKLQRERMRALAEIGLVNLEMNDAGAAAATMELALEEFQRLESSITPSHADALTGLGRARLAAKQGRRCIALAGKRKRILARVRSRQPRRGRSRAVAGPLPARARSQGRGARGLESRRQIARGLAHSRRRRAGEAGARALRSPSTALPWPARSPYAYR